MGLKELLEKKKEKQNEMLKLVNKADGEERAMTEDEIKQFEDAEAEVRALDANIEAVKKAREIEFEDPEDKGEGEKRTQEEAEERAFERFIRSESAEERADVNWTKGSNGALIPTTIANRIIETVKDVCPIWERCEHFNIGGDLNGICGRVQYTGIHFWEIYKQNIERLSGRMLNKDFALPD